MNFQDLKESLSETKTLLSPTQQCLKKELIQGKGAYIGYKLNPKHLKTDKGWSLRRTLSPAYYYWGKRNEIQPLDETYSALTLLELCESEGVLAKKVRKYTGNYITLLNHKDYQFGSTLISKTQ